MEEQSALRVRCKHGSLIVDQASGQISLDPGLVRWRRPRWSFPTKDICALSASHGIGVTFTLTLQTTDSRELHVEWLLPHDAQRVASALGYSLTLYDLHEMAAERELGTPFPFTYDLIALEPDAPGMRALPAEDATRPIQPVIEILPAGKPIPPPLPSIPSIPAQRPRLPAVALARLTSLAAALWLLLRPIAARFLASVAARVRAWQARHSAPAHARVPSQPAPLGLADALAILSAAVSRALSRARRRLSPVLAALQARALRLAATVHTQYAALREAVREAGRASAANQSGARTYLALLAAVLPRLRSRLASTILVIALILAVIAASALQATPSSSSSHHGTAPVTGEVIHVLPRLAPGGRSSSSSAAPSAHASQTTAPLPSPTATPTQAPAPPPPPPSPALTLAITCAWAQDGRQGQVCVRTQPGAALTISITYCDGRPAHNKSLQGTVSADAAGSYVWSWVPATRCIGPATAIVTARWQGQTISASAIFEVTLSALPPAVSPAPVNSL